MTVSSQWAISPATAKQWSSALHASIIKPSIFDMIKQPTRRNFADYEMKRFGYKDYGFFTLTWSDRRVVRRYRCSYPNAVQQFKLWLITRRLTSWL